MTRSMTPREQLELHSIPEPNSGCFLWFGSTTTGGYGRLGVKGKLKLAHRVAYECAFGDPGDLDVLHKCDVPCCINPDHLFLGVHAENMADMVAKKRQACGERQGSSVLSPSDVLSIRSSLLSERRLAKKYGVVPSTIRKARLGVTWKSL